MPRSRKYSNMSDEQEWGADTTTQGPPPSHRREGLSIVSSSQLSPKSPAPWDNDRGSRSERHSWGDPGEERIDRRRRSTVTFGGATSVAPSDSISKVKMRSGRDSGDVSAPGTQYSRRSRRRSAPWQEVEYRSTYPSKAGSSQGGTLNGAPLTEGNLEEFNERRPPRSDDEVGRELERDAEIEQLDRRSSRKSRRDSGVSTQQPETRAGGIGADDRRTSRQYSRVERDGVPAERTVVTTRRKMEVEEGSPDEEEIETKSKSRYESYSRPAASSTSKISERRKSRAADVYAQASERRASSAAGRQSQKPRTSFSQRSRPPTMPPESSGNARTSRDLAVVAAGSIAGSRHDGKSRAQTAYVEEVDEEETRQTEARSERYSSRQDEDRTRQMEVRSERISEREGGTERKSAAPPSRVSGRSNRQSQALTRPSQAAAGTAVAAPTSPSSGPSSPTSATSPTAPFPDDAHWERRVHIVETRKPDGKVILDREYSLRRIWPQQEQQQQEQQVGA